MQPESKRTPCGLPGDCKRSASGGGGTESRGAVAEVLVVRNDARRLVGTEPDYERVGCGMKRRD